MRSRINSTSALFSIGLYHHVINPKGSEAQMVRAAKIFVVVTAIAAARKKLDIFAEKPLALTIAEGRAMVDAVEAIAAAAIAGGATAADVALMRRVVGSEMGVKAAGGVRDLDDLKAMVAAGATRIGASAGVKIVQQARNA